MKRRNHLDELGVVGRVILKRDIRLLWGCRLHSNASG